MKEIDNKNYFIRSAIYSDRPRDIGEFVPRMKRLIDNSNLFM